MIFIIINLEVNFWSNVNCSIIVIQKKWTLLITVNNIKFLHHNMHKHEFSISIIAKQKVLCINFTDMYHCVINIFTLPRNISDDCSNPFIMKVIKYIKNKNDKYTLSKMPIRFRRGIPSSSRAVEYYCIYVA